MLVTLKEWGFPNHLQGTRYLFTYKMKRGRISWTNQRLVIFTPAENKEESCKKWLKSLEVEYSGTKFELVSIEPQLRKFWVSLEVEVEVEAETSEAAEAAAYNILDELTEKSLNVQGINIRSDWTPEEVK